MYLSDKDIRSRIEKNELKFECENGIQPFDLERQISPCSVDLRLSNVFWKANKKTIDLKNPFDNNKTQSVYWKKIVLGQDGCITLHPGDCYLGRIHESITIPLDCAGKIESKSGINRLAISVTFGDFCNPGFIGHYPLQIVNLGSHTVKLFPYMGICQLILIPLSSATIKIYHEDQHSNYSDGIGGPSKYWADKIIKGFKQETYGEINSNVDEISQKMNDEDVIPVIKKFQTYYYKNRNKFSNDVIYLRFKRREKRNKGLATFVKFFVIPVSFFPFIGFCGANIYNIIYNKLVQNIDINVLFLILNGSGIAILLALSIIIIVRLRNMVFYIPNK